MSVKINFKKYTITKPFVKNNKKWIYDDIRKMDVLLTPEEIVRQQVIQFLLEEIPKHMNDKDCSFIKNLLPWSENLPAEIKKS